MNALNKEYTDMERFSTIKAFCGIVIPLPQARQNTRMQLKNSFSDVKIRPGSFSAIFKASNKACLFFKGVGYFKRVTVVGDDTIDTI